jgi:hypothetical protein
MNDMKKKRNRLLYTLVMITIIVNFSVLLLSGPFLKKQIFIDVIPKQPMNSIKGIDQEPIAYIYK